MAIQIDPTDDDDDEAPVEDLIVDGESSDEEPSPGEEPETEVEDEDESDDESDGRRRLVCVHPFDASIELKAGTWSRPHVDDTPRPTPRNFSVHTLGLKLYEGRRVVGEWWAERDFEENDFDRAVARAQGVVEGAGAKDVDSEALALAIGEVIYAPRSVRFPHV